MIIIYFLPFLTFSMTHLLQELGHLLLQFLNALFVAMVSGGRIWCLGARLDSCWGSRSSSSPTPLSKLGRGLICLGHFKGTASRSVCLRTGKQILVCWKHESVRNVMYLTVYCMCSTQFRCWKLKSENSKQSEHQSFSTNIGISVQQVLKEVLKARDISGAFFSRVAKTVNTIKGAHLRHGV